MKSLVVLIIACSLFRLTVQELTPDAACGTDPGTRRGIRLSVNSRRNETGDWVDIFTARAESSNLSDRMNLDVTHNVIECQGKRVIYIQGVSQGKPVELSDEKVEIREKLTFHPRCGKNVAILPNGRTAQKLKLDDTTNSALFTNRPLEDNEIFEIKMGKKNEKKATYSITIGVITGNPDDVEILPEMHKSPFAHLYFYDDFYSYGKEVFPSYGKDIEYLQVGDTVGVMRSQYGTLHFFVNGTDQGPAVSNIPSPVYGIFELRGTSSIATIVDASS